jgi:hypothetical protein
LKRCFQLSGGLEVVTEFTGVILPDKTLR